MSGGSAERLTELSRPSMCCVQSVYRVVWPAGLAAVQWTGRSVSVVYMAPGAGSARRAAPFRRAYKDNRLHSVSGADVRVASAAVLSCAGRQRT